MSEIEFRPAETVKQVMFDLHREVAGVLGHRQLFLVAKRMQRTNHAQQQEYWVEAAVKTK